MSEAIAEPPALTDDQSAAESFNAAMAADKASNPIETTPLLESTLTDEKIFGKPVDASKSTESKAKGEFPDAVLGTKLEPKAEDPDAILSTRPTGQIKHDHFAAVQARAAEHRKAAETLRAELESLKASAGKPSEEHSKAFEATRTELEKMREELARVAFERTPEFNERFTKKEARIVDLATKAATDAGLDAKTIKAALLSEGARRFQILEEGELSGATLSYVSNLMAQHDELQIEKADVLSRSKDTMGQWQEQQKAQQANRQALEREQEESAFNGAVKGLSEKYDVFRKIDGEDDWNAGIDADIAESKKMFNDGSLPIEELAQVPLLATAFRRQSRRVDALMEKNQVLTKRVQELTAAGPQINGNGHQQTNSGRPMTDEEHARQAWDDAHRARGE